MRASDSVGVCTPTYTIARGTSPGEKSTALSASSTCQIREVVFHIREVVFQATSRVRCTRDLGVWQQL